MGGSGGGFGQQRRGHGAGLGADRLQQQQQVTGGNYPKAKHLPAPTKMYISIQKQCLFYKGYKNLRCCLVGFCLLQSKSYNVG